MDLILVLTYTAFCIFIFKVFKIPLNKWTVPTAILGGIVLIGALLLIMNYNHPYAKYGKDVFICCSGCEEKLTNEPAKYLAMLKQ